MVAEARQVIEACAGLEGAALGDGAFAPGPAIWVGRREVAHVDKDGMLDIRLTKRVIAERRTALRADPRVQLRSGTSDWLSCAVSSRKDVDAAVALVAGAVTANLPSAPPGRPPAGAELERRRRLH